MGFGHFLKVFEMAGQGGPAGAVFVYENLYLASVVTLNPPSRINFDPDLGSKLILNVVYKTRGMLGGRDRAEQDMCRRYISCSWE